MVAGQAVCCTSWASDRNDAMRSRSVITASRPWGVGWSSNPTCSSVVPAHIKPSGLDAA